MRKIHVVLAAVAGLATSAAAQVEDHLTCYKARDTFTPSVNVDLLSSQLGLAPGCRVQKAQYFCVPSDKTAVVSTTTGLPIVPLPIGGPNPGDRICYNVRCPVTAPNLQATDQLGVHNLSRLRAKMMCTPAVKGSGCVNAPPPLPCGSSVSGSIASDVTFPAGCDTFIDGQTTVAPNVSVYVQPGATVKGLKSPVSGLSPSTLVFLQGSRICAPGTPVDPIVFTSDQPPGARAPGDWGGLVFNGRAATNCVPPLCTPQDPFGNAFGGSNDDDSSGLMRYVRIEFAGFATSPGVEIDALDLNGVGRGTEIDHVQMHATTGSCLSVFGGTVDAKHLVATACGTNAMRLVLGYTGRIQFGLVHDNATLAAGAGNGIVIDNNEFNFLAGPPETMPQLCNLTVVGSRNQPAAPAGRDGARLRRGTEGQIFNAIFQDWSGDGMDIRNDPPVCSNACTAGSLAVCRSLLGSNTASCNQACSGAGFCNPCTLWSSTCGLTDLGAGSVVGPTSPYPVATDDRYFPAAGGPADGLPACASSPFFDSAPYAGAFLPGGSTAGGDNWMDTPGGWISFDLN